MQETKVIAIMAQFTAEEGLKVKVEKYLHETPKIDEGLKTLLSLTIAKNQTTSKEQTRKPLSANICLELIRSLSLAINKIEVLETLAWASKFPQKQNTTGMTRMDEISNYKALSYLHSSLKNSNNKIKVTKAFGVSFLKTKGLLHRVLEQANIVLKETKKRKPNLKFDEDDVTNFYKDFSKSVYLATNVVNKEKNIEVSTAKNDDNNDDTNSLLDIVWLPNWKAEILKRRQLRREKVKARMKKDEEIAKDLVKEHMAALKEKQQYDELSNTSTSSMGINNSSDVNNNDDEAAKPDILQVSSVIRDTLIKEGYSKINVLNALIDSKGDIDKAREMLITAGTKTP